MDRLYTFAYTTRIITGHDDRIQWPSTLSLLPTNGQTGDRTHRRAGTTYLLFPGCLRRITLIGSRSTFVVCISCIWRLVKIDGKNFRKIKYPSVIAIRCCSHNRRISFMCVLCLPCSRTKHIMWDEQSTKVRLEYTFMRVLLNLA